MSKRLKNISGDGLKLYQAAQLSNKSVEEFYTELGISRETFYRYCQIETFKPTIKTKITEKLGKNIFTEPQKPATLNEPDEEYTLPTTEDILHMQRVFTRYVRALEGKNDRRAAYETVVQENSMVKIVADLMMRVDDIEDRLGLE